MWKPAGILQEDIKKIKDLGCKAGVSLNPETPVSKISSVLPMVDLVLVMSVHPGFGEQEFIPEVLEKVRWIRKRYPKLDIQIDGGIDDTTAPLAVEAGANILVGVLYTKKQRSKRRSQKTRHCLNH